MYFLNRRVMKMCAQLHTPAALLQMGKGLGGLSISKDALGKGKPRTVFLLSCLRKFFGLIFLSVDVQTNRFIILCVEMTIFV